MYGPPIDFSKRMELAINQVQSRAPTYLTYSVDREPIMSVPRIFLTVGQRRLRDRYLVPANRLGNGVALLVEPVKV